MYQRHSTEEKKITSFFGLGQFMAVKYVTFEKLRGFI